MAAALPENKSLQERINALHIQLKAANEESDNPKVSLSTDDVEKSKPKPGALNFGDISNKKPRPGGLDFGDGSSSRPRPGGLDFGDATFSKPRPGGLDLGAPPPRTGRPNLNLKFNREKRKSERTAAIERQLSELTKKSAILAIDGQRYPFKIEDLELLEEIGSGTCGVVNKMYHPATNTTMAVKIMGRTPIMEEQKRILMDLDVITRCNDCPYIVNCFGLFISQSDVFVCMELMGTCLEKLLRTTKTPVPEPILGKISLSVVRALQYLKSEHGVMHRDIKPSNILLDERGNVKLCDFGISGRLVDSKAMTKGAGCAAYMAPERVEPPDPRNPNYDVRADVWSLGISLVELATGVFPYTNCRNEFEVLMKIIHDPAPTLPANQGFSEEFQSFIKVCLEKDRDNRPKFDVLLEHPFLIRYCRENVDVVGWYSNVTTYV